MSEIKISVAAPSDAAEMLEIYSYYVDNTAISFEYTPPTTAEFAQRIEKTLKKYPWIKAELDGKIIGYAYTGAFKERDAYIFSAETSIYVSRTARRSGVGRLLYSAIENISKLQHILNLNACIGCPKHEDEHLTFDSMRFHEKLGYSLVGKFNDSGYKFSQWYDMIWMEKMIGEHTAAPLKFRPFPEISPDELASAGIKA